MRDRLGQVTAFRVDALQSAPQTPSLHQTATGLRACGDHWAQSTDSSEASVGTPTVATSQPAT